MNPTPERYQAALAALDQVLPLNGPADVLLSQFFHAHRNLGTQDRQFIAETVFGVLRHRYTLEWLGLDGARGLLLGQLAFTCNQRQLNPILSEEAMARVGELKAAKQEGRPLNVAAELPEWVVERLLAAGWSETDIREFGSTCKGSAPLDLRVNGLLAKREAVQEELRREGIEAVPTSRSPLGLRVQGKPSINRLELFRSGRIEVQDEGSQLLGYLVAPRRHELVVDFCAGAGGKTLLLGSLMQSQGRLYAFDVSEKRLANLRQRLKRSGLSNVHPQLIDSENDTRVKRLAGKIDRVLVDAPCSGLGTLRRNPDLKWRQSPQGIVELSQRQRAILASASRLCKVGGRLVYATCSLLPEENTAIVEEFLASHPQFQLRDAAEILAGQHIAVAAGPYLQLLPHRDGTDGFFAAAMERVA